MPSSQPSLPGSLLVHILSYLALETRPPKHGQRDPSFSNARLASKALRQAADEVPQSCLGTKLVITSEKLLEARAAGLEDKFLGFLIKMVRLWQRADVYIYEVYSLRRVLHSLGSSEGRVGSTGSLQRLTLHFAADGWGWWTLPEEVGKLTTLTKLKLLHFDENMPIPPAAALGWLSTLTALQSLLVIAPISGPWPSPALSSLQQLTNLSMCFWDPDESYPAPQLGSAHLAPLKALRRLDLDNIMLSMSGKQVLGSWQHMEELSLSDVGPYSLGFWEALCRLPRLTKLVSNCDHEESSASLRSTLSAFPRLAELWLNGYSEPALPHLPTTLTHINLYWTPDLCAIPFGPALRSLHLFNKWGFHHTVIQEFPPQLSAMTQLTKLELDVCNLTELPAPLAALPSLEILSLKQNYLEDLPQDLASMGCLRTLILDGNLLQRVPRVLCTGAASRLECLNIKWTMGHSWEVDEVELRSSLLALTTLELPDPSMPYHCAN